MSKKPALGLTLPVQRGSVGFFNTSYDVLTQVRSNLTNLILTRKGERIMQPTFGCGIHNLLFENITDDLIASAKGSIMEAVQVWLPFVNITNIEIKKDEDENSIYIKLSYKLKTNNNITDTIVLSIG